MCLLFLGSQSAATKKAPAKRSTAKSQATLSFAPSGRSSTRAAASRATKKMADVVSPPPPPVLAVE